MNRTARSYASRERASPFVCQTDQRPVTVPKPWELGRFFDMGADRPQTVLQGTAAVPVGRGSWYVPLYPPDQKREPKLTDTTSKFEGFLDQKELNPYAPSAMYPHVVKHVNDIRAGNADPNFLDAPFSLQPGESYILQSEKFEFNRVVPPKILKAVIPGGGWANQPSLVPPNERTEALLLDGRRQQAEKLLMTETHAKMRTVALMQSNARAGITGVEAPTTAGSLVYANQRAELLQFEQQQQGLIQSRRTAHSAANGSNDIFGRNSDGNAGPLKMWQTRKKYPELRVESKDRLFQQPGAVNTEPEKQNFLYRAAQPHRQQHIRNNDTNGKPYDIITGCIYNHVPPSIPEKVLPRKLHPSVNPGPEPSHVTPFFDVARSSGGQQGNSNMHGQGKQRRV